MTVAPERYRQIVVASLVALFVVIVAGAAVRLTNSGLGCDDWPKCNTTTFVDVSSKHAVIEQVNRLFNGLVTIGSQSWKIQGNWSNAAANARTGYANVGCIQTS